jgi:GWxTD domain-containing protein
MQPRTTFRLHLFACAILGLANLGTATDVIDRPDRNWRNGPVRYLLTRSEDQAFKALATDAERAEFIRAFWARRDPTPETLRNEFRDRFVDRVRATESLRRYQESSKEMWVTDMGKFLILLGPPISEERDQVSASTRDTVVWTYDEAPGVRAHNFVVAFVADESGELHLSDSPALDMATTQGLAPHTPLYMFQSPGERSLQLGAAQTSQGARNTSTGGTTAGGDMMTLARATALGGANTLFNVAQFSAAQGTRVDGLPPFLPLTNLAAFGGDPFLSGLGGPSTESALSRAVALGEAQALSSRPPSTQVQVSTSFEPIAVDLRTDFYEAADGTTYAAFTLAPTQAETAKEDRWTPFGALVSLDREEVRYSFAEAGQFAAAGPESPGTFQTGLGVDPGRYRVLFGLRAGTQGRLGYRQFDITVPDLRRPALALSSLTLAQVLEAAAPVPKEGAVKVPFVLGGLRVVPRPSATFRNGEEFHLYYQVYGAGLAANGKPSLAIRYRFSGKSGDAWEEIGPPILQTGSSDVQAWSFPLRGWPPGQFRLNVEVQDQARGNLASAEAEFTVTD